MASSPYIVTKGVVLRETETRDADKILTLLTAERGKLSVIARGVCRKGCKFAACAQPLAYSEWTLYKKGDWYYANEGATLELFNGLRADLDAMALGFYLAELTELDQAFTEAVAGGNRHMVVFGDRFPLLYFCKTYGLEYRAAFHGCAGDTEPSLATLKYLIDKVQEEGIPVVYTIELSSRKVAQAIAESTGAKVLTFQSCQTVSRQDFDAGATYLSLMRQNVAALKEGLA